MLLVVERMRARMSVKVLRLSGSLNAVFLHAPSLSVSCVLMSLRDRDRAAHPFAQTPPTSTLSTKITGLHWPPQPVLGKPAEKMAAKQAPRPTRPPQFEAHHAALSPPGGGPLGPGHQPLTAQKVVITLDRGLPQPCPSLSTEIGVFSGA